MIENFHTVIYWTGAATWVCAGFLFIIALFTGPRAVERDEWDEVYGDQPASPPDGYHRTGKDYRP